MRGGPLSVTLDQEELKTAKGLLCLLSATVKTLMRPLLKTTDRFQKQNTRVGTPLPHSGHSAQGGDDLSLVLASCGNMTPWASPTL